MKLPFNFYFRLVAFQGVDDSTAVPIMAYLQRLSIDVANLNPEQDLDSSQITNGLVRDLSVEVGSNIKTTFDWLRVIAPTALASLTYNKFYRKITTML